MSSGDYNWNRQKMIPLGGYRHGFDIILAKAAEQGHTCAAEWADESCRDEAFFKPLLRTAQRDLEQLNARLPRPAPARGHRIGNQRAQRALVSALVSLYQQSPDSLSATRVEPSFRSRLSALAQRSWVGSCSVAVTPFE